MKIWFKGEALKLFKVFIEHLKNMKFGLDFVTFLKFSTVSLWSLTILGAVNRFLGVYISKGVSVTYKTCLIIYSTWINLHCAQKFSFPFGTNSRYFILWHLHLNIYGTLKTVTINLILESQRQTVPIHSWVAGGNQGWLPHRNRENVLAKAKAKAKVPPPEQEK